VKLLSGAVDYVERRFAARPLPYRLNASKAASANVRQTEPRSRRSIRSREAWEWNRCRSAKPARIGGSNKVRRKKALPRQILDFRKNICITILFSEDEHLP
jgi:hypothetical protein